MARAADTLKTTTLIFIILQQVVLGSEVSVTRLDVPSNAIRYTNQTLTCEYELSSGSLYSIKWYFKDEEFFRYTPSADVPLVAFNNSNIQVILEESKENKVVLREVDLTATGEYKCEVGRDWPGFAYDDKAANMTVLAIPNERPRIEGVVDGHFRVDDLVNLNCTAAPSMPAATLLWYINDDAAPKEYLREYNHVKTADGLFISTLGLNFKLTKTDFIQGELKLKCTATIATLYHKVEEHSQVNPPSTVVRELPPEGSLVTANGPTSGSESMWNGLLERLVTLHVVLLFSVHLLW
ncbi:uncharacterized protein LOC122266241 [Penaeus japonicus]|uniref:uncharacterized protein LOC122266241 n=1 Tax=Penaeus japonicus TaxID=27405 RepID=UPI001C71503D|nr:uncharacterized protein LOC122266241 [Penaeus japonicus]